MSTSQPSAGRSDGKPAGPRRPMLGRNAFTIVELLVVVTIMVLLMTMLLPVLGKAKQKAADTRTRARVAELAGGCDVYKSETGYYPGQAYPDRLSGSNPAGLFTGSQYLAACLFGYDYALIDPNPGPNNPDPVGDEATSKYAPLRRAPTTGGRKDDLQQISGRDNSIWDRNKPYYPDAKAILYYPARLGVTGLGQYRMDDNSDYKYRDGALFEWDSEEGKGTFQADFEKYIKDRRFEGNDSNTPYSPEKFLLIAAGIDRLYGTADDIRYGW